MTTSAAVCPVRRVHPHVQRRVVAVGEAALGHVELHRRDPEVEQDAVDAAQALGLEHLGDLVVDRVHEADPVRVRRQPRTAAGQRLGVAVEPDQPHLREAG